MSAVLLVVGVLGALLTPPAVWARDLVLDTHRYTATLAPVGRDPGVRAALVAQLDRQFAEHLDVAAAVREVLPVGGGVLAGPVQAAATRFVHDTADRVVASPQFATLWDAINRRTHAGLVRLLTGRPPAGGAVQIRHGVLVLDLTPLASAVRDRLASAGLRAAEQVPVTGAVLELGRVRTIERARGAARLLDRVAAWLPWVSVVLLVAGVLLARRRRRAVAAAGAGVAIAMVLLSIGLAVGRHAVLAGVPASALDRATVGRLFDALVRYLHAGIRSLFLLALLALVTAWASGHSASARRMRSALRSGSRRVRTVAGPLAAQRRPVQAAVVCIAALVLVLTTDPTRGLVLGVLGTAGAVVVGLEVLRAGRRPAEQIASGEPR